MIKKYPVSICFISSVLLFILPFILYKPLVGDGAFDGLVIIPFLFFIWPLALGFFITAIILLIQRMFSKNKIKNVDNNINLPPLN